MTTDASPARWAIALAIALVYTVLRTLIALEKWDGTRFASLRKGARSANIVGAAITFLVAIACVFGLLLSLSK